MYHAMVISCMAFGAVYHPTNLEKQVFQQLKRDGTAIVRLEKCTMELQVKEVKGGKLIHPVIVFRTDTYTMTLRAASAELEFNADERAILLRIGDCSIEMSNGGKGWMADHIWSLKLSPSQ